MSKQSELLLEDLKRAILKALWSRGKGRERVEVWETKSDEWEMVVMRHSNGNRDGSASCSVTDNIQLIRLGPTLMKLAFEQIDKGEL